MIFEFLILAIHVYEWDHLQNRSNAAEFNALSPDVFRGERSFQSRNHNGTKLSNNTFQFLSRKPTNYMPFM